MSSFEHQVLEMSSLGGAAGICWCSHGSHNHQFENLDACGAFVIQSGSNLNISCKTKGQVDHVLSHSQRQARNGPLPLVFPWAGFSGTVHVGACLSLTLKIVTEQPASLESVIACSEHLAASIMFCSTRLYACICMNAAWV